MLEFDNHAWYNNSVLYLQMELSGSAVQLICGLIHIIWRCRGAIVRGHGFADATDLTSHLAHVMENPWVHGIVPMTSKRERRSARVIPPPLEEQARVYQSDGASRRADDCSRASTGVLSAKRVWFTAVLVSSSGTAPTMWLSMKPSAKLCSMVCEVIASMLSSGSTACF